MGSVSVAGSPTRSFQRGLVGKSNMARGTVVELLAGVKHRSHLKMCARLDEAGVVSEVDAMVAAWFHEWAATRMMGLTEETNQTVQRIMNESVVWVIYIKATSGGLSESEAVDFEGKAKSLNCEALMQQLEDVAQQYGWTVNHMSTHLIKRNSLKEQAREVLQQAKQTGDEILVSKAPLVGDIVEYLLRCYQLKFKYLLLLGKPIDGAIINILASYGSFRGGCS